MNNVYNLTDSCLPPLKKSLLKTEVRQLVRANSIRDEIKTSLNL